MPNSTHVLCFTDILCGYSYVAHARFEQLKADFGDSVRLSYHFRSTYGDVQRRMEQSGKTAAAYGALAREMAERFDHVAVHPDVFQKQNPTSSMPAHLYLRAVKLLEDEGVLSTRDGSCFERLMWQLQVAFFRDLRDVSQRSVLDEVAADLGFPIAEVARVIDNGRAFAELDHDTKLERRYNIQMSPAVVLNEGRQVLNGNVGYRVIEANIRELLCQQPASPAWL